MTGDSIRLAVDDGTVRLPMSVEQVRVVSPYPEYTGPTSVTPSDAAQTLLTQDTVLREDIVVEAIPSNYGRITWNGSALTIS